jgi:hypothetical protein
MKKKMWALASVLYFLAACGPTLKDAQELGFSDVQEMRKLKQRGFATKLEYETSEQKRNGFSTLDEYRSATQLGLSTPAAYEAYQRNQRMIAGGFDNLEQLQVAESMGIKSKLDYNRFIAASFLPSWQKIYSKTISTEKKGGVYIEKHWFSADQIAVRPSESFSYTSSVFINNASIRKINDEIREGAFTTDIGNDPAFEETFKGLDVEVYQVNCGSSTLKQVANVNLKITPASTKSNIDPVTGKETIEQIPEEKRFSTKSVNGSWTSASSKKQRKFVDALCKNDVSVISEYEDISY